MLLRSLVSTVDLDNPIDTTSIDYHIFPVQLILNIIIEESTEYEANWWEWYSVVCVAPRPGFEPGSQPRQGCMIGHYTIGAWNPTTRVLFFNL